MPTLATRKSSGSFLILIGLTLVSIQAFVTDVSHEWPYVVGALLVLIGVGLRIESAISATNEP